MSDFAARTRIRDDPAWTRVSNLAARTPSEAAVMAQARGENFPVASVLLPRRTRSHLLALYGFARLVDDVGDEAEGDRVALLDELEADLERVWGGTARHPLIARLRPAVVQCHLPIEPFRKLIEANRRDQMISRYETFEQLLDYCDLSAATIGELVLRIFGAATPERLALSEKVCSALQLVEHWQDVAEDYRNGRIYLPAEDRRRFGVHERDLGSSKANSSLRQLMAFETERTRNLLEQGAPLARTLSGRYGLAVRLFVGGGRSTLRAIERAGYDVLASTPRAGTSARARELLLALLPGGTR
jgi:squalene synthase HpnC